MNRTMRKIRKQAGMTTAGIMVLMMGFTMVGLTVMTGTIANSKHADRSNYKSQANLLAESAVNKLYDKIRDEMRDTGGYPFAMARENVTTDTNNGVKTAGWHEGSVVRATNTVEDVDSPYGRVRRYTYTFVLEGRSETSYGIKGIVRSKFTAIRDLALVRIEDVVHTGEGADLMAFPAGAVVANGKVNFKTDNGVKIYSPDGIGGHIIANDGVSWDTARGNKSSVVDTTAVDVQGLIVTTNNAKAWTESNTGLGNSNGSKNYRSPRVVNGDIDAQPNGVFGVDERIGFADDAAVFGWAMKWGAQLLKPGTNRYMSGAGTSTVAPRVGDGWKVIQTPAFINGDLDVANGETLRLMPHSSNPAQNLIFVNGDVKNMGALLNLGCTIVFTGKYTDDADAEYKLDTNGSPLSSNMRTLLQSSMLLSTKADDSAFEFKTNKRTTTGVIYAARGGMKIKGKGEFEGMILAGGKPPLGNIDIEPDNGSAFAIHYEPDAAGAGDYTPDEGVRIDVRYVAGGVVRPFTPSKLADWQRRK